MHKIDNIILIEMYLLYIQKYVWVCKFQVNNISSFRVQVFYKLDINIASLLIIINS